MSDGQHNKMGPVMDATPEIQKIRVTKYAEEQVAYGTNYFLKVCIDAGLYIHIRIHRPTNQEKYDFYALHEIIKHNVATCVFTEDDPLTYFNY